MSLSIAPELDASLEWLGAPQRLAALRGQPVVLLFWNRSSANCHNALQAVAAVQQRHRGQIRVLGIHVPKFDAERDPALARDLLAAHGLSLLSAHDRDWVVWQHYEVGVWPTVVLVDPAGAIHQRFVGDRAIEELGPAVEALLDAHYGQLLSSSEPPRTADSPGLQIGGLVASPSRLYVADSGRHRLLECSHDGRVLRRIGSGHRDFADGLADAAGFNDPRGLVLLQDRLYVADAGNHALRRVDVRSGEVDTLVGQGRPGDPVAGHLALPGDSPLDRPWALAAQDSTLYFGNAAGQQCWAFELGRCVLRHLAGSGLVGHRDGPALQAEFAQPAAMLVQGDSLWVLDAGASALRQIALVDGSVRTVIGKGLFEFGHKDGGARQALWQNPTGLALTADGQGLWIADTGNGVLRRYAFRQHSVSTPAIGPGLRRPGALAAWQQWLWVADVGSRALWRLDTGSGELQHLSLDD
ncbi:redoxin domain-containing protein [Silanimonas sp.]|uniref:redoxin domain-containing protein n=1 Tax=Silanimonas sp. TaxID=1929290 RepID=UPI001BC2F72D|nr:redoxin domain-containing protein [Silanimonas sp.]MBS3896621.1 redoxin domain-containing protein [Silanimonas sp.]MBS3923930.1 redoxin domain-containing protein [Xanthomonadaceae bacterium]